MHSLWQDTRHGLRMLAQQPGFTAVAILTLALGIGASTAIFSVVNTVLLAHLPYKDPSRLAMIWGSNPSRGDVETPISPGNFSQWKQRNRVFEDIAASFDIEVTLTGQARPQFLVGYAFSANYFRIFGVAPELGRTFTDEEDRPGAPKVVVLSDKLWRDTFHGDAQILGKSITLDSQPHTVIGVMPPEFRYPGTVQFWIPTTMPASAWSDFQHRYIRVMGRLKPGVSLAEAQAQMALLARQIAAEHLDTDAGNGVKIKPLREQLAGDIQTPLLVLLGAVGFLLLIACANVAGLLLARAARREKEIAVRVALGAGRARLLRQFLTESLLLSLAGGVLGVLLAVWCSHFLLAIFPNDIANLHIPKIEAIPVDARVLFFAVGAAILTGVIFGVTPAMHSARAEAGDVLKESGRGATPGSHSARLRRTLVVAEIALSLVLLAGAGLLVKSFERVVRGNLGFHPEHVLSMQIFLPPNQYPREHPEKRRAFVDGVLDRLEAVPGVQSAAAINFLPLTGFWGTTEFLVEGRPLPKPGETPQADNRVITPDYFRTMGIPLLRGRAFTKADRAGAEHVAIINSAFAERYFGREDPVGKLLNTGSPEHPDWWRIVGVVGDVKAFGLDQPTHPDIYRPFQQIPFPLIAFTIRTAGDPAALITSAEQAVWDVDKDQPIFTALPIAVLAEQSVALRRVSAIVLAAFAALALLLAAIGLYGVIAYAVAQRTHEIGIRMALGAQQKDVLRLVLWQGTRLTLAGVVIGMICALALTRLMTSLLYGVSGSDPLTFAGTAILLIAVALVACYIPARRATRVDPMVALRYE